jgi:N-acetylmuramic acid 6-phosphate etherase
MNSENERSVSTSIIQTVMGAEYELVKDMLVKAKLIIKLGIVTIKANTSIEKALNLLIHMGGDVRKAISFHTS